MYERTCRVQTHATQGSTVYVRGTHNMRTSVYSAAEWEEQTRCRAKVRAERDGDGQRALGTSSAHKAEVW